MAKSFRARIKSLPNEQGGLLHSPQSGIRPQLKVENILTSCTVCPQSGEDEMELGKEYDVTIEVLFWEHYKHLFTDDMEVELHDGGRIVGRGQFLEKVASL